MEDSLNHVKRAAPVSECDRALPTEVSAKDALDLDCLSAPVSHLPPLLDSPHDPLDSDGALSTLLSPHEVRVEPHEDLVHLPSMDLVKNVLATHFCAEPEPAEDALDLDRCVGLQECSAAVKAKAQHSWDQHDATEIRKAMADFVVHQLFVRLLLTA